MTAFRHVGSIVRVADPGQVQAAFKSSGTCGGVLLNLPQPDCVKTQLADLSPVLAWKYRHSLSGTTDTLPELHRAFSNVAAYMRDVTSVYETVSLSTLTGYPARGEPMVYVGDSLAAPWHFDASEEPFAIANPGHIHLIGHAMRLMSVEGTYQLPLHDHPDDASQLVTFEDVDVMRKSPGLIVTEIDMLEGDLLFFNDTCLHISGKAAGADVLKLRASLSMYRVQADRALGAQPATLPETANRRVEFV